MSPSQWRHAVGEAVWERLRKKMELLASPCSPHDAEEKLTELLQELFGLTGLRLPATPPTGVAKDGGRVFWPREDGGTSAMLTAEGLANHWARKGHGFLLLRARQLCRAAGGPLLQPLADLLGSYEYECQQEHVSLLPTGWRAFVGGNLDRRDAGDVLGGIEDECPTPAQIASISARTMNAG